MSTHNSHKLLEQYKMRSLKEHDAVSMQAFSCALNCTCGLSTCDNATSTFHFITVSMKPAECTTVPLQTARTLVGMYV